MANISTALTPVGLVQNVRVSQGKQIQQLFEIGSRKPFYVPGRTQVNGTMSRVLFDGASLFYALYRSTAPSGPGNAVPSTSDFNATTDDEITLPTTPYPEGGGVVERSEDGNGNITTYGDPGRFWSNLRSEIFNIPLGLGVILFDMEGDPYGGMYLEQTYIRSHDMSVSAQQTIMLESVSFVSGQIRPLSAESINT